MGKLDGVDLALLPPGKYEDGNGLRLVKRSSSSASFHVRFKVGGKRREVGLGSLKTVSLIEARRMAKEWLISAIAQRQETKNGATFSMTENYFDKVDAAISATSHGDDF